MLRSPREIVRTSRPYPVTLRNGDLRGNVPLTKRKSTIGDPIVKQQVVLESGSDCGKQYNVERSEIEAILRCALSTYGMDIVIWKWKL